MKPAGLQVICLTGQGLHTHERFDGAILNRSKNRNNHKGDELYNLRHELKPAVILVCV
jgi:hypothetical protein